MRRRKQRLELSIGLDGKLKAIYSDDLRPFFALGDTKIERVSSVEPEDTEWVADLTKVGGPILGPFTDRSKALLAEVEWLKENYL